MMSRIPTRVATFMGELRVGTADCGLPIGPHDGGRPICNPQSAIALSVSLRSVSLRRRGSMPAGFPFDVPVVRSLETLKLSAGVTFLVGENGSGKSTLLEALALRSEERRVGKECRARRRAEHEKRRTQAAGRGRLRST